MKRSTRPPTCPVVEDGELCGLERYWSGPRDRWQAACPKHGRRKLSKIEIECAKTGKPYPERRAWSMELVRRVKVRK